MLRRFLKSVDWTWRRYRHALKEAHDPYDYADKAERLAWWQEAEKAGHVDVFYGDESWFCLTSAIPYAWQFPGKHVATRFRHGQCLNVLGFYNAATNELHSAAHEGTLDAAFVIDTLDAWTVICTWPTVLVLVNARLHTTATSQALLAAWDAQPCTSSTCPSIALISTKSKRAGAKSNMNSFAQKPTPPSKP